MANTSSTPQEPIASSDNAMNPEQSQSEEDEIVEESAPLISPHDANPEQRSAKAVSILITLALISSVCTVVLVLVTFVVATISQPCA